jgi:hypothetical protein
MSEYTTPSQAEGEPDEDGTEAAEPQRTTPSQAEGEDDDEESSR